MKLSTFLSLTACLAACFFWPQKAMIADAEYASVADPSSQSIAGTSQLPKEQQSLEVSRTLSSEQNVIHTSQPTNQPTSQPTGQPTSSPTHEPSGREGNTKYHFEGGKLTKAPDST